MIVRWIWALGISATALLVLLRGLSPLIVQQEQNVVFDLYQRLSPRAPDPASPVQMVDIDDASLAEFGQWPWPRTYLAEMIRRLYDAGAAVVALDVLMSEPDRTSPEIIAQSWNRFGGAEPLPRALSDLPAHDAVLADAIAYGPTVLAIAGAPAGAAPAPLAGVSFTGQEPGDTLPAFPGALTPLPQLREAASGLGSISLVPGADGVTRGVPMVTRLGDKLYPSFTAEILRVAQGAGSHILRTTEASGEISGGTAKAVALRTGRVEMPLDGDGVFRVHFAHPQAGRITSAARILNATDLTQLSAEVAGKIVLVGSSAQSLYDIRLTPLGDYLSGTLVQAMVLDQVLNGEYLTRPDWMPGLEIALIVAMGLLLTALAARDRTMTSGLTLAVLTAVLGLAGWGAFQRAQVLFDPSFAILAGILAYLPGTTLNVIAGRRARAGIRQQFASFVPEALLEEITADPEAALTPDGSERALTVMFVDMKGFSTTTEKMTPQEVVNLLNTFLTGIARAVTATGGTIDKFIGDAVMAFWNAPIEQPDHMRRGLTAVHAVEREVERANVELTRIGLPTVEARIGVNTGPAFVGLMGSTDRLSYSCVGDSVNLAARLEGATRIYGTTHLIGSSMLGHCPEAFVPVTIDSIVVKGRSQSEAVSIMLPADHPETADFAESVAAILSAQRAGDWAASETGAARLAALTVPGCDTAALAAFYRSRAAQLAAAGETLPDGGYVATAKR